MMDLLKAIHILSIGFETIDISKTLETEVS